MNDIKYSWMKGNGSVSIDDHARQLPQFTVAELLIHEKFEALSTGKGAYSVQKELTGYKRIAQGATRL